MTSFFIKAIASMRFAAAGVLLSPAVVLFGCGQTESASPHAPDRVEASQSAPAMSLESAIMQGDDRAVHAHILAGTPVNATSMTGDTPLHVAAAMGRAYAVEVLIGAGAELEAKNSSGVTPLFSAAFFCHANALELLIESGARRDTTDQNGNPVINIMELPWDQIRPVYEMVHASIGLPFDAHRIESARPAIADMLR